jgi:hypothetical protein
MTLRVQVDIGPDFGVISYITRRIFWHDFFYKSSQILLGSCDNLWSVMNALFLLFFPYLV